METLAVVRHGPMVWIIAAVFPLVWGMLVCWILERLWPGGGRAAEDGGGSVRLSTPDESRQQLDGARNREFLDFQI
jgi:hypothetical protein